MKTEAIIQWQQAFLSCFLSLHWISSSAGKKVVFTNETTKFSIKNISLTTKIKSVIKWRLNFKYTENYSLETDLAGINYQDIKKGSIKYPRYKINGVDKHSWRTSENHTILESGMCRALGNWNDFLTSKASSRVKTRVKDKIWTLIHNI